MVKVMLVIFFFILFVEIVIFKMVVLVIGVLGMLWGYKDGVLVN